jgi:hypothetical protein
MTPEGRLVDVEPDCQADLSEASSEVRLQREATLISVAEDAAEDVDLALVTDCFDVVATSVDGIKKHRDVLVERRSLVKATFKQPERRLVFRPVWAVPTDGIASVMTLGWITE